VRNQKGKPGPEKESQDNGMGRRGSGGEGTQNAVDKREGRGTKRRKNAKAPGSAEGY